jgi:hypothetical protein
MRLRLLLSSCLTFLRITYLGILLLPYVVIFVAAGMNQAVFIANHDRFPVMENDARLKVDIQKEKSPVMLDHEGIILLDNHHCLMSEKTHLNFLGDIFDLQDGGIMSPGDLVFMLGEWLQSFCYWIWGTLVVLQLTRDHLYDGET